MFIVPHPPPTSRPHCLITSSSHQLIIASSHELIISCSNRLSISSYCPPGIAANCPSGIAASCRSGSVPETYNVGVCRPGVVGDPSSFWSAALLIPFFSHVVPVIGQPLGTNPIRGMRYGLCSASPCPCPTPEGGMGFRDVSRLGVLPGSGRSHIWRDRAADNCCPECA